MPSAMLRGKEEGDIPLQQNIEFGPLAEKIFIFDEVFPLSAARELADKKKTQAFGSMVNLDPRMWGKEKTIMPVRHELRLEPFWHVVAQRSLDYDCQLTYPVPVHNPYAQTVQIDSKPYTVSRQGDKARIQVAVKEACHRKIRFADHMDGLKRAIRPAVFENYISKYKFSEVERPDREDVVAPLMPFVSATQAANAKLNAEAINAHEIHSDSILFERAHLYLRPVFAFEFVWSSADRQGVVEIDGLTGEVLKTGEWFKDKLDRFTTRDAIFDLGAGVAGLLVPGGGLAVKVVKIYTDPDKPPPQ